MFCSFCKNVEPVRECRRKICPLGHIVCQDCDGKLKICTECSMTFSSYICVEMNNKIPRLFIVFSEEYSNEQSKSYLPPQEDPSLNAANSLHQSTSDIKYYESHDKHQDQEDGSIPRRVFSYFEIADQESVSSFHIEDEEEREIMKNFKICEKSTEIHQLMKLAGSDKAPNASTKIPVRKSHEITTPHLRHDRQIQTSKTYVVNKAAGDSCNLSMYHPPSSMKVFTSKYSDPSYNYTSEQDDVQSIVESFDASSVFEIFKNKTLADDSETANFTSITVTTTASTPTDSPTKGIPSLGHRVKFSPFYYVDGCIPVQMEPITFYDSSSSDSTDLSHELPSDLARRLPRFPVRCPITNCESWSVPSDFCNHITIDHPYVDVQKSSPDKLINLKINHKGNVNMVTCQRLFLVTDKITDIGYGAFENCLPITLLTSKISLGKTFGFSTSDEKLHDEVFYIFLAGVYQFPMNYTITLWTHGRNDFEPTMIKCMSNSVLFMNNPFNLREIAGNSLAISHLELQKLTDDGNKMLSCQIMFH